MSGDLCVYRHLCEAADAQRKQLIDENAELLAALKALVEAYEDPQDDDPHALVVAAKDAIDRAEGC